MVAEFTPARRRRAQLPSIGFRAQTLPLVCAGSGRRLTAGRPPGCSDYYAAAIEAREGEAVELFAQGSALIPQHGYSHFLAERH